MGIIKKALALGILYFSFITFVPAIAHYSSERNINSQEKLEKIVNEEKKKLKCDKEIKIKLTDEGVTYTKTKMKGNEIIGREIIFRDIYTSRNVIKHELYHACKQNPQSSFGLDYFLWNEPTAIIYSITGIEL